VKIILHEYIGKSLSLKRAQDIGR